MKQADLPTKIQIPFASSAGSSYIRAVPVASQIGIVDGAASFMDGFPPLNAQPESSGGIPPFIQDFNGIFNQMSAIERAYCCGALFPYDATYATEIGGYPNGAVVSTSTAGQFYLSTADDNLTVPGATGATWTLLSPVEFSGGASGYLKVPSPLGVLLIQWGQFTGTTGTAPTNGVYEAGQISVTFPVPYGTLWNVIPGGASDVSGFGNQEHCWKFGQSNTGCVMSLSCRTASAAMTGTYIAIGLAG